MHGLIFVTWEKYLTERFRGSVLKQYRDAMKETVQSAPLASRVYDDAALLAGVGAASRITRIPADTLLEEFGHYFILNGLTRHLCAYLLTQVQTARELLLMMHDAHEQMSRLPEGLTPPLFEYDLDASQHDTLIIIYDSPRKLCSVLHGAIKGAATRYGEHVSIVEERCMKRGAAVCRFNVRFLPSLTHIQETPEQRKRQQTKRYFAQFVLSCLPDREGMTLEELGRLLTKKGMEQRMIRPAYLLEALHHLQYVGLVATTANRPEDQFIHRRYWRMGS